jgi:hypothetical protein
LARMVLTLPDSIMRLSGPEWDVKFLTQTSRKRVWSLRVKRPSKSASPMPAFAA